jgi:hypothetical protein
MRRLIALTLLSLGLTGGAAMADTWHNGIHHGPVYRNGENRGFQRGGELRARGRENRGGEFRGREARGFRPEGRRGGESWRFRDHAWRFERR